MSQQAIFSKYEHRSLRNNLVCFCELLHRVDEGISVILSGKALAVIPKFDQMENPDSKLTYILF